MTPTATRLCVALVVALLTGPLASAATGPLAGRIVGTVTDAQTGETLIGASARIAGTSIGAATDVDGRFSIPNAPSGPQTLVVSYVGYVSDTLAVDVPDGGTLEVEAALSFRTLGGVEVTAQVAGQLSAINEQFSSATVGNVVSSDRIQELPDNNAAESIGRLPGVSIQRSGGEANRVAIRGLAPKYNTVTVNGVRLPSTDGNERSVDLSLVSSNVLDGIEVRKAITPDQDGDAIGGTIDLRLRNAPSRPRLDLLAQGGYTALQDYYGNYKVVGTASNRFFRDRLGVIATFNTEEYDRSADKVDVLYAPGTIPGTNTNAIRVNQITPREETITRGRLGGSLLMDYTLPNGRFTGNAFYNSLDNDAFIRRQQATPNSLDYIIDDTYNETSLLTSALGAEQDFGLFRYDATLSYTQSRSHNPEDLTFNIQRRGGGFTVNADSLFYLTPSQAGGRIVVDSTAVLESLFATERQLDEDQIGLQLNVQVPFRLGESISGYVKTGGKLRWLDRSFDVNQIGRTNLQDPNPPLFDCLTEELPQYAEFFDRAQIPISILLADYERGDDFLEGAYGLGLVADEDALTSILRALQSQACSPFDPNSEVDADGNGAPDYYANEIFPISTSTFGQDYAGRETYQAGYVMGRFDFGDMVTVIPGVRVEADQTTYDGQVFRALSGGRTGAPPVGFEPLTSERSNTYWLPMVHFDVRPADWLSLRAARTETISRPNYNQYAPIISVDAFYYAIQAANLDLRAAQATNYDVGAQVVREGLGLVGVNGFYKQIDDLVYDVQYITQQDLLPLPDAIPTDWYVPAARGNPIFQTTANNEFPTEFYGVEFEWQTNFSYLPGALRGLVLNANYTRSWSETTYQTFRSELEYVYIDEDGNSCGRFPCSVNASLIDTTRTGRMPGQSAHIANVTLGYDFKGFSARLSYLFQSGTTAYVNPTNSLLDEFVGDYSRFDLSVRQALSSGIEVFANLNNLNNRPDQRYTGLEVPAAARTYSADYLRYRELYGFTADVGIRYRL